MDPLRLHEGFRFINNRLSGFSKLHADAALPQSIASDHPETKLNRCSITSLKYCPVFRLQILLWKPHPHR